MQTGYARRRDVLLGSLREAGFTFSAPDGAYYGMADIASFADLGYTNDVDFTRFLVRDIGVACVPCSSFCSDDHRAELDGDRMMRFCFCKTDATLPAAERFQKLARCGERSRNTSQSTSGENP